MSDLIISVDNNQLKLSLVDQEKGLLTSNTQISLDSVSDSRILNSELFAKELEKAVSELTSLNKNKLTANFLVEPSDVILKYLSINKQDGEIEDQIQKEIETKLEGVQLDTLYFSYQKIAPFIYQFIAVEKDIIEKYLEVSEISGISLKSVLPWVLLLPKFVKTHDPAIFLLKNDDREIISISELGGVFFSEKYKKEKSAIEIPALTKDLSLYKRSKPIRDVYTINYEGFELEGYDIQPIKVPQFEKGSENLPNFEINVLTNFLIDTDEELLFTQNNLLNLLPVPVVANKNKALVATGGVIAAFVLVSAIVGGVLLFKDSKAPEMENQLAQNEQTQVLSEHTQVEDTSTGSVSDTESESDEEPTEIDKGKVLIRIENGAGINGLAGKTQDYLREKGYMVLEIDTADKQVENTLLQFKKSTYEFKDIIVADIEEDFPQIDIADDLDEESEYDLLIILGSSSEL